MAEIPFLTVPRYFCRPCAAWVDTRPCPACVARRGPFIPEEPEPETDRDKPAYVPTKRQIAVAAKRVRATW